MSIALLAVASLSLAQPPRAFALAADPTPPDGASGPRIPTADVRISVYDAFAIVEAELVVGESGPRAATALRFPGAGVPPFAGARPCEACTHRPLVGFEAQVDGKPVVPAPEGSPAWHVVPVPAGPGAARVKVRYGLITSLPSASGAAMSPELQADGPDVTLWYLRSTGAAWAGATAKTTIAIVARGGVAPASIQVRDQRMPAFVLSVPPTRTDPGWRHPPSTLPPGGKRTAEGVQLVFAATEPAPADDLEIIYTPNWHKRFAGMTAGYGGEAYKAKISADLLAVMKGQDGAARGALSGRVVDWGGSPVGNVDVVAYNALGAEQIRTRTSPAGTWALAELPVGRWILRVDDRVRAYEPPARELDVTAGPRTAIDFAERTGPSVMLASADGKPFDGLALLLPRGTPAPVKGAELVRLERLGLVGVAHGGFGEGGTAFREVTPGTYTLLLAAEEHGRLVARVREVSIPAGPDLKLPHRDVVPVLLQR